MDKQLLLIWKKIDGVLTTEELAVFESLQFSDPTFVSLYQEQLSLNNGLSKNEIINAPNDLFQNVMNIVAKTKTSYVSQYSSFNGIRIIGLGSLVMVAFVSILTYFLTVSSNSTDVFPGASAWISSIDISSILFGAITKYGSYSLVLVAGLILVWLDSYFKSSALTFKMPRFG